MLKFSFDVVHFLHNASYRLVFVHLTHIHCLKLNIVANFTFLVSYCIETVKTNELLSLLLLLLLLLCVYFYF